jgi:hypothetical protein
MSDSLANIIGEALILSSIQSSLGSVEMSSKFSIMNFAKDQNTLDNAQKALNSYILIALLWTIGTSLVLYTQFSIKGVISGIIANGIILVWIVVSYRTSFKKASEQYNLKMPSFNIGLI